MIRWVEDLGAPAVVTLADVLVTEQKPDWYRPVGIGLAAAGYVLGGVLGMGGGFVKNLGIAAAPWAFKSIYEYIKEATSPVSGRAQQVVMQPRARMGAKVASYPAQPQNYQRWPSTV
jgi:hypothetical protein